MTERFDLYKFTDEMFNFLANSHRLKLKYAKDGTEDQLIFVF